MNWLMIILRVQFCYELGIVHPLADLNGNRSCCIMRVSHSYLKGCLYTQEEVELTVSMLYPLFCVLSSYLSLCTEKNTRPYLRTGTSLGNKIWMHSDLW